MVNTKQPLNKTESFLLRRGGYILRIVAMISLLVCIYNIYVQLPYLIRFPDSFINWCILILATVLGVLSIGVFFLKRWAVIGFTVVYSILAFFLTATMLLFWNIWDMYGYETFLDGVVYVATTEVPLIGVLVGIYYWKHWNQFISVTKK